MADRRRPRAPGDIAILHPDLDDAMLSTVATSSIRDGRATPSFENNACAGKFAGQASPIIRCRVATARASRGVDNARRAGKQRAVQILDDPTQRRAEQYLNRAAFTRGRRPQRSAAVPIGTRAIQTRFALTRTFRRAYAVNEFVGGVNVINT